MQDKKPAVSRRSLFAGAATVGAVAAATSVLPTAVQNAAARGAPELPKPERGGGFGRVSVRSPAPAQPLMFFTEKK